MRKSLKQIGILLLTLTLILSNFSTLVTAENNPSTIKVNGENNYINEVTVRNMPDYYKDGNYKGYCADLNTSIRANHTFNTTYTEYTQSRRVAYVIHTLSARDEVKQELIWKILNGNYSDFHSNSQNVNTAKEIWNSTFAGKTEADFPEVTKENYNDIIFLATTPIVTNNNQGTDLTNTTSETQGDDTLVLDDETVALDGPASTDPVATTADTTETTSDILDETNAQESPVTELPKTAGIPLELFTVAGTSLVGLGLALSRKKK